VLGAQPSKNELALVRRLFVPSLVQVDQDGVKRRVARRQDLPADAQTLVDRFVTQRLLVTDQGSIEVAHEAILRQWPALAAWIDAERDDLVLRDRIEGYAALWGATKKNKHQRLVTRGRPLSEARDFLRRKPQWMSPFARSFVHKSIAAARRGSITLTLIGALLVGATAIGGQQVYQAQQNQHALQTQMLRTDVNGSVRAVAVSPGEYSADNAGYAQSLTDALASPNMSLVDALFEAHRVVFERMQGAQRPILTTDLNGPAFLHARNEHRRIYALIVSCSDYEAEELPDLERPEQDAEILEEFLLRAGVLRDRVRRLRNPTRSALMEEIVRLEQRMSEERPHQRADLPTWDRREVIQAEQKGLRITAPADRSLLLVYYAGQGVSIDGEDMLVPTDARFNAGTNDNESSLALRSAAVRAQLVAATELENSFAHAAAVRVFIYDTQFMSPWSSDR
jgi:type IV secretory pathway TrbF-like protein